MNWSRWNPFKPFGRGRTDVIQILEAVLARRLDCREWDSFLRIPMKGTPDLEAVRVACEALESEEKIEDNGTMWHTAPAQAKIRDLLQGLKEDPNQSREPMPLKRHGSS
jgi:hypothetical protein